MNDLKTAWKKSSPSVPQVAIAQIVHQCETIVQRQKCFKGKLPAKASKEDKIDTKLPRPTGITR